MNHLCGLGWMQPKFAPRVPTARKKKDPAAAVAGAGPSVQEAGGSGGGEDFKALIQNVRYLHLLSSRKQDINYFALLLSATRTTADSQVSCDMRRPRVTPHGGPRAGSGAAEALTDLPTRRLRRWCLVAESSSQVPAEPCVM